MEYRIYPEGTVPYPSTAEFHADRERAPHLEQPIHQGRLHLAEQMIRDAVAQAGILATVSDLGCGDGGLLSLVQGYVPAWGYDFAPSNQAGWAERGVQAEALDVFGADRDSVRLGSIVVTTEVLEHLADPHGVVGWIAGTARYLVASSPWTETDVSHDACHTWAWDMEGYRALLEGAGFDILRHEQSGMFQVILGKNRAYSE